MILKTGLQARSHTTILTGLSGYGKELPKGMYPKPESTFILMAQDICERSKAQ